MRTPEGQTFGPASRADLDRWVSEGRVTADCELKADDGPWYTADSVYGVLRTPPASQAPAQVASSIPQSFPRSASGGRPPSYAAPHRGGLVLALALLGCVTCCPILSIMAWVMGNGDLREMREGRLDPEGFGLTQAGYMLGLILSMFWILGAVVGLFIILLNAAAGR
jgi:hypothetical protein